MQRIVPSILAAIVLLATPFAARAQTTADRGNEPVIVKGAKLAGWSGPAASIVCMPYPSGALTGARDAHNGTFLTPPALGIPVAEIAAYRWDGTQFVEIPVQVDEMYPYCLSNPNSSFGVYSGTDMELTYAWDVESWKKTGGICTAEYPLGDGPLADPVPTLDDDDEVVFMARDAGGQAPVGAPEPAGATDSQVLVLTDALDPATLRFVYLFRKPGGSSFTAANGYVDYARDANADEYIDRYSFDAGDPQQLGSSNTGYGPNLSGSVCVPMPAHPSTDRFPRDGVTVSTDAYRWRASGRWMVREMHVAKPNQPGVYGPDLVDRWKGRAFQQAPDSTISLVGFEDEQVNWEANSSLLGERRGPVRAIRETWGADSGTNVTKTESFYRSAITYHYHVRVHPIPPDGLYTSWDYNRGVVSKYFNVLKPDGVDIDGVNDDQGNIDSVSNFPAYFDIPDPTFSPPTALFQWEEVSGAGDNGSLVYIAELKGATTLENPAVVPYYRDDACLDDGTGDNPVQRPWPGEASSDSRVLNGYCAAKGLPAGCHVCRSATDPGPCDVDCKLGETQGAYASHGIHYFVTNDTDNAASPGTLTEIDAQQWQFAVPTEQPTNVGAATSNVVLVPLQVAALNSGLLPTAPPFASDGSATTDHDVPVTVTLGGFDLDSCELGFTVVTPPAHGTLGAIANAACASGTPNTDSATVLYTPAAGFDGSDSFTFKVNDGTSDSLAPGTVSITVNGPPAPTATPTPAAPTATPTPTVAATATGPTVAPTPHDSLCGDAPRSGCKRPTVARGALLTIKERPGDPSKTRLMWKWGKGQATAKAEFGIPTSTTDYALCIYDGNDELLIGARAPRDGTCRTNESRPCWKENSKGYRYVDRDLTPDGLQQMQLKAGPEGKAQIVVKGRGNNLQAPPLSVMTLPVRVQTVNGGGACWEATFTSTSQNTTTSFKARSD
jgi:Bacterial Ig domain